jgi:hypothetical protein
MEAETYSNQTLSTRGPGGFHHQCERWRVLPSFLLDWRSAVEKETPCKRADDVAHGPGKLLIGLSVDLNPLQVV